MEYDLKESLDALKNKLDTKVSEAIEPMQKHLDSLDCKIQGVKMSGGTLGNGDPLAEIVTKNFSQIKDVSSTNPLEIKASGTMLTSTSLTGEGYRTFGNNIAVPATASPNFSDIITSLNINTQLFTFPREIGSEGDFGTPAEGAVKSQIDFDIEMIDVKADYIAGFTKFSNVLAANLPFLTGYLPNALRRKYFIAENANFYTAAKAEVTQSTTLSSTNEIEHIISDQMDLITQGWQPSICLVNPVDYQKILTTAGTTGTGTYSVPASVRVENGYVVVNQVNVIAVNWVPSDEYLLMQPDQMLRVQHGGLNVKFTESDTDDFQRNLQTARCENMVALAVLRGDSARKGLFSQVA